MVSWPTAWLVIALLQLRGDRARNFQIHMAFVLGGGVDPDPKWTNWNDDCFGATGPTFCFFVFRRKWGFHQKWRGEQHCLNLGFTDTTKLPQIKEMEDFKCNIVKFKESIQTSLKTHKIPLCFPIFPEAFPRPWQKTHAPRAWPGSVTILFMGLW